ncbi:MAG: hypothetical protein ABSD58_17070 [Verrucomicrobiia bacterium]|jgi:hypothetical protein
MNSEKLTANLKPHLETAEKAVAAVKDPRLREIAFGRILDHLLGPKGVDSSREKAPVGGKLPAVKAVEKSATHEESRKGATGGLRSLVDEGDLDTPKTASEIISLLKKEGRHYRRDTVLMGLLNLVRKRVLTRFKEGGDKNWKYVIRR